MLSNVIHKLEQQFVVSALMAFCKQAHFRDILLCFPVLLQFVSAISAAVVSIQLSGITRVLAGVGALAWPSFCDTVPHMQMIRSSLHASFDIIPPMHLVRQIQNVAF